jgi:hypothetical protein
MARMARAAGYAGAIAVAGFWEERPRAAWAIYD